jgi:hypothetical protein
MKQSAEYEAFNKLVDHVLSVPHSEIMRREQEYKRKAALNPRKRGPKPKVKPRAS